MATLAAEEPSELLGTVRRSNPLILALDVDNAYEAIRTVGRLREHVFAFKVGLELFNATGPTIFDKLKDAGADRIFYDCKLHDIPNTVAGAMRAIARRELWMVNLHAAGGSVMVRSAADALRESAAETGVVPPLLIGVTLLTSLDADDLANGMRVPLSVGQYVVAMAQLVQEAGGHGVVTSPREIQAVRAACGPDFLIVTPGVRPAGVDVGDQRRTMTPEEAIRQGAQYLVVGRAITAAPDPVEAAESVLREAMAGHASA